MNEDILKEMVAQGLSTYKISAKLGKSRGTVRYWLDCYGLNTKRIYQCSTCLESTPLNFSKGRFSECKKCRSRFQTNTTRKYKRTLVEYKGGKCIACGYAKCKAALDFHHRDPHQKDINWKLMRKWTPEKVKKEVDKCDLLCKNCHIELHYPDVV